jgi:hypothetical protein
MYRNKLFGFLGSVFGMAGALVIILRWFHPALFGIEIPVFLVGICLLMLLVMIGLSGREL